MMGMSKRLCCNLLFFFLIGAIFHSVVIKGRDASGYLMGSRVSYYELVDHLFSLSKPVDHLCM